MTYQTPEEKKKEYLHIGEMEMVSPLGERKAVKPEEAELMRSKGWGFEVVLYHETEAPYIQNPVNVNAPNANGGKVFLDYQADEAIASGWSKLPVGPNVPKAEHKKEEHNKKQEKEEKEEKEEKDEKRRGR